jgi:hypothetical protein
MKYEISKSVGPSALPGRLNKGLPLHQKWADAIQHPLKLGDA